MSTTDNNSAAPLRKDKAPVTNGASENANTPIGFRPQQNMAVEPPRAHDLQPSYATIVANDANPKGWYGSMSMSPPNHLPRTQRL
jgi:erythrocyte band 7 integral membrane protein